MMAEKGIPLRLKTARRWAPRQGIAPKARRAGGEYVVASNGSAGCYGGWDLVYPAPKAGEWISFRVLARWRELQRGLDSVNAAVRFEGGGRQVGWEPLLPRGIEKGRVLFDGCAQVPDGTQRVVLRLCIAWSARGELFWGDPQVLRTAAPRPRRWRLGAASGKPVAGRPGFKRNTDFYLGLCEQAATAGVDLLVMPEVILDIGIGGPLLKRSVTVPGPRLEPFQQFARKRRMAMCFSVHERNGELVHNTAVLIDKRGGLAGKYRKVHLAQPGEVWEGVTPGHDFPVFNLHGARIGMNICMDSSAAESARVPARKGAEIICMPIMGDHRATVCMSGGPFGHFDLDYWRMIQSVRALDNQVYMVVSRNNGVGSGVFSPRGKVLAMTEGPGLTWADVDLAALALNWNGGTYKGICWYERREPAYGELAGGFLQAKMGTGSGGPQGRTCLSPFSRRSSE